MDYETLEDFLGDIVGKARKGQGIEPADLARKTGLSEGDLSRVEAGTHTPKPAKIRALAQALGLSAPKLEEIAGGWVPREGNIRYETPSLTVGRVVLDAGMRVNAYVLKCRVSGEGAAIDAGAQPERILAAAHAMGARIGHILLTHGHGDHVGALEALKRATGAKVCACPRDSELMKGRSSDVDIKVDEGWTGRVGHLTVRALSLPGHTPGGIGYLADTVLFSGDALFAGSLGGARGAAYGGQIEAVRNKVLSLGGGVRIFPGHGPITTVAEEKAHNPFFA